MNKYSESSLEQLRTVDTRLIKIFTEVLKYHDHSILEGYRGELAQSKAFHDGKSKLEWPDSFHNKVPSLAVDVAPYPIDFGDQTTNLCRFYLFAGFVLATAQAMGIHLRYGGDWKGEFNVAKNKFNDLVHFEIIP